MRYLILVCALALSACKTIKVKNGEVPDDYRAMAEAYMGSYAGAMEDTSGALKLEMQGRKVVLSYTDSNGGNDLLDARCKSRIGNLETVQVSKVKSLDGKDTYKLDAASFAFDPNRCWGQVEARSVDLDFTQKKGHTRVDLSLLVREELQHNCRIDPGNPRQGRPPREICDNTPIDTYATGRFQR